VGLVERLRQAGFTLGTSELIDATQLLLELGRRRAAPLPADHLRAVLRPVLCKASERRAEFDRVFDDWYALVQAQAPADTEKTIAFDPPLLEVAGPKPGRRRTPIVVGLLAVGLGILVVMNTRTPAPKPQNAPVPIVAPVPAPYVATPEASGPAPAITDRTPPIEAYAQAVVSRVELRPSWFWALAALPLLAFVIFNVPALVIRRQRGQPGGQPLMLDPAPLELEARRLVPPLSPAIADRLARHLRGLGLDLARAVRRPRIDERRTVEATLRNRGVPTVRWAATPMHPSYLVLVDVAHEADPRGRLFFQWALRLRQQGLDVTLQVLRRDAAASADEVFFGPPGPAGAARERWRPLHRLATPPYGQRLIVVSDGSPLVDENGRWRLGALRARLHRWRDRALFTPLELRDWGARETALERRETPVDPGLTVLPLDESALLSWTSLVLSGHLSDITLADPQRFPALLRRGAAARFMAEEAPPTAELERLLQQLRLYMGEAGLRWMAALAVAPVLRWELTLLLGRTALALQPELADERSMSEALARYYRRLVRLPWLQRGSLPDWLRLRLLLELSREEQRALQDRVRQLLEQLAPREGRDGIPLGFDRPPGAAGQAAARQRDAEADSGADADADADKPAPGDLIYVGTMSGLSAQELLLRAPAGWAQWAGQMATPAPRGLGERLREAREQLHGAWARRAFVDGLPHLGARPATRWLAPLLAAPLAVLLISAGLAPALGVDEQPVAPWLERRVLELALSPGLAPTAAVLPSGGARALLATAGGRLGSFDLSSGRALPTLWPAFGAEVRALVGSPGGEWLALLDSTGAARLFDARSGRPVELGRPPAMRALPPATPGGSLAFGADGGTLVVAHAGGAWLWRLDDPSRPPQQLATGAASVAAAPGGRAPWTALWTRLGYLYTWTDARQLPTGMLSDDSGFVLTFSGGFVVKLGPASSGASADAASSGAAPAAVPRMAASADGRWLALAFANGELQRLRMPPDLPADDRLRLEPDSRIAFVGQGSATRLLAFDARGDGHLIEPDSGSISRTLNLSRYSTGYPCLAPSLDGETLLVCATVTAVKHARAGRALGTPLVPPGGPRQFERVAISPDGERVAAIGRDGAPVLWGRAGGPLPGAAPAEGHGADVIGLVFVDGGQRLVSAGGDGRLRLWSGTDGGAQGVAVAEAAPIGAYAAIAASADGQRLISGDITGALTLHDSRGVALGQTFGGGLGQPTALALSPDGRAAVVAYLDGSMREWRSDGGTQAGEPRRPAGGVLMALAYSADGRRIAGGSTDGSVHLWSAADPATASTAAGEATRVLTGHREAVTAVGFDRQARRVVAVALDGQIRQWELNTGQPVGSALSGPNAPAGRAAISADARVVAMPAALAGPAPAAAVVKLSAAGLPVAVRAALVHTVAARDPPAAQLAQSTPPRSSAPASAGARPNRSLVPDRKEPDVNVVPQQVPQPQEQEQQPQPQQVQQQQQEQQQQPARAPQNALQNVPRNELGPAAVWPFPVPQNVQTGVWPFPVPQNVQQNVPQQEPPKVPVRPAATAAKSPAKPAAAAVRPSANAASAPIPPVASPVPAPSPAPGVRHGLQLWQLDAAVDSPRLSWPAATRSMDNAVRQATGAGFLWGLAGLVFVVYVVHGAARGARLQRGLASGASDG